MDFLFGLGIKQGKGVWQGGFHIKKQPSLLSGGFGSAADDGSKNNGEKVFYIWIANGFNLIFQAP